MRAALRGRLSRRAILLIAALVIASTGIGTTLAVNYFYGETTNSGSVYQTRTLYDPTAIAVTVKDNNTAGISWTNPTQQEAGLLPGNGDGIAITGSYASTQQASCTSSLPYTPITGVVPSGTTQSFTDNIGASPGSPMGAWVCYRVSTWTAASSNPTTWNSSTAPYWTALNVGSGAIAASAVQVGFVATATGMPQTAGHAAKKGDTATATFDQPTNGATTVPNGYYLCIHQDAASGVSYAYAGMAVSTPGGTSCGVTTPTATPTVFGYWSGATVFYSGGDCIFAITAGWNSTTTPTTLTLTLGRSQNTATCSAVGGSWTYHPPTAAISTVTVLQTKGSSGTSVYAFDGSDAYYSLPTTTGAL